MALPWAVATGLEEEAAVSECFHFDDAVFPGFLRQHQFTALHKSGPRVVVDVRPDLADRGLGAVGVVEIRRAVLPRPFHHEDGGLVVAAVGPLEEGGRPLHPTAYPLRRTRRRDEVEGRLADGLPDAPGVVAKAEPLVRVHLVSLSVDGHGARCPAALVGADALNV